MLADELVGKTVEEARRLEPADVRGLLGVDVGPRRIKCALLCLHALRNTLHKMEGKEPQGWKETLDEKGPEGT